MNFHQKRRVRRPAGLAWRRVPLLACAGVAMATGLGAGLARIGLPMPAPMGAQAAWHGPWLLAGVFGVLIALERAVAVSRWWAYAAPLAGGLGSGCLLVGAPAWAWWAFVACGLGLVVNTSVAASRQPAPFMAVLGLGAACAVLGPAHWALGHGLQAGLLPMVAFLVFTIAGERLELARFAPQQRRGGPWLMGSLLLLVGALGLDTWLLTGLAAGPYRGVTANGHGATLPTQLFGLGLCSLAGWLAVHDVARRTVCGHGLARFVAVALLSGYAQLAVAGTVLLLNGLQPGTAAYDAALHTLLLGFVMAMVMGHAPLVGPALLRISLPFHRALYLPLTLLHASVLLRCAALAAGASTWRQASGMLSVLAVAAFMALLVRQGWRARPTRDQHRPWATAPSSGKTPRP